jgi:hypothetical protein
LACLYYTTYHPLCPANLRLFFRRIFSVL